MAWAEKQYHQCLFKSPEADAARRYSQERGISDESIERFHLGFSPLERDWILRHVEGDANQEKRARRAKILEAVGILARPAEGGNFYDRFRGRLLFSIRDAQGRPVGIGGRVLPELGTTEPGEVRQFARNAAVHQEQAALRPRPGPRAVAKDPNRAGDGGLHRRHRGPQYGFQNAVAVLGRPWASRTSDCSRPMPIGSCWSSTATRRAPNGPTRCWSCSSPSRPICGFSRCRKTSIRAIILHKYGAEAFSELLAGKAVDALDHAYEVTTRGIDVERDVHGVGQAIERLLGIVARVGVIQRIHRFGSQQVRKAAAPYLCRKSAADQGLPAG